MNHIFIFAVKSSEQWVWRSSRALCLLFLVLEEWGRRWILLKNDFLGMVKSLKLDTKKKTKDKTAEASSCRYACKDAYLKPD